MRDNIRRIKNWLVTSKMGGTNSCSPLFAAGPGNALKRVTLCPRVFKLIPNATKGMV